MTDHDVDEDAEGREHEEETQHEQHPDGAHGEGGDAVGGEVEHLQERIFCGACRAFPATVAHLLLTVAEERDDTPQEKVAFAVFQKVGHGASSHQTEIGVVAHALGSERLHGAVECFRRRALKP